MHFHLCIFVPWFFFPCWADPLLGLLLAAPEAPGLGWRDLSLQSSAAFPAFANRWHFALTREQPEQGLAHGTHTMVPVWVRRVSAPIHVEAERLKLNLSEDSSIASLLTANTLNTQLPQVWKLAHFLICFSDFYSALVHGDLWSGRAKEDSVLKVRLEIALCVAVNVFGD